MLKTIEIEELYHSVRKTNLFRYENLTLNPKIKYRKIDIDMNGIKTLVWSKATFLSCSYIASWRPP